MTLALVLFGCEARRPIATAVDPPIELEGRVLAPATVKERLSAELGFTSRGGRVFCVYSVLAQDARAAYLWVRCEERSPADGASGSGLSLPVALDLQAGPPARIVGVRRPRDGNLYADDVKTMFPRPAVQRIFGDAATLAERDASLSAALAAEASAGGPTR